MLTDYIAEQPHVTPQMRSVLCNWILTLSSGFNHHRGTFLLSISLVDRVLNVLHIHRSEFQLLGAVCVMLAA